MTDVNTIASRRREILGQHWAKDAKYVDPLMSGEGHDGVEALIAGVQQRFPDFRFHLIGEPNGFGVFIRHRPQVAYLSPSRWLSSVRSLRILMRSTRFSIPKSVKAITPSSPTP